MRFLLLLLLILQTPSPSANRGRQQEPAIQKQDSSQNAPSQSISDHRNETTEHGDSAANQPEKRPEKPPWWDAAWGTWALVVVGFFGTLAAVWTLITIRRQTIAIESQVKEMRETGKQTDQLIAENIAQSTSMQKSVAEAARLAAAMEVVAKEIAVSSKAATASVSAIGQQMRAYICVVIGSALYQERAKNMKFQAVPSIVNAGLTPAHKVTFRTDAAILPIPLPEDFTFPLPDTDGGTSVIGPRQNISVTPVVKDFVDDAEVEGIKSGHQGKGLYTWGIFTYEDIFGKPQYTKFCHLYTWLADGKTTWGYYASRHNDAS